MEHKWIDTGFFQEWACEAGRHSHTKNGILPQLVHTDNPRLQAPGLFNRIIKILIFLPGKDHIRLIRGELILSEPSQAGKGKLWCQPLPVLGFKDIKKFNKFLCILPVDAQAIGCKADNFGWAK